MPPHPQSSAVNPVQHRLRLDWFLIIEMLICSVTLLPFRLVLVALLMLVACLAAVLLTSTFGFRNTCNRPRSKALLSTYQILLKLITWSCGLWVEVRGRIDTKRDSPILVVAPHSSFFDMFIVPYLNMPVAVSRSENRTVPLLGHLLVLGQSIFVERTDPRSRHVAADSIIKWVKTTSDPASEVYSDQKLLIFPEGYSGNRKAVLPFKTGAFRSGRGVQPVLIEYLNSVDTTTWTWDQPHNFLAVFVLTLCRFVNRVRITILPTYFPTPEEIQDPKLFSENVRLLMAETLHIPISSWTSAQLTALREAAR